MQDHTEGLRREVLARMAERGPMTAAEIAMLYNTPVYTTEEMPAVFTIISFLAPFVRVRRIHDKREGWMTFQHKPRLYFGFDADPIDE